MITLSIVIPAYNEENGIADIAHRVLSAQLALENKNIQLLELLIIDDGSKDQTAEIAEGLIEKYPAIKVIRHKKNRGYGAALKTGFYSAQGEIIGFLDADGTYPPESFPELCEEILNGHDLVIGSRMAGAESKMPLTRRIGNLFFARLLTLIGFESISDSASGMRVFKRGILDKMYPLPDGLNLTPIMSTRAVHEGIRMKEVPITYSERVGRSKLSVFRDGSIFLQSMLWTVMTYNPVRILGLIGLASLSIASLIGLGIIIARVRGITSLGPWGVAALYTALVTAVAGISIISLGATFNYLVALFYKRPVRQGLFGRPILNTSLESHFGWIGLLAFIAGFILAITSLGLGVRGWEITRIWFYLLGSAMLTLVGIQLVLFWILMRMLKELSQRELNVERELSGA